jgi:hypothetical protein
MLVCAGMDRYGEEIYVAEIVRFPDKPPQLEPWERLNVPIRSVNVNFDALRKALRPQG